MVGKRPFAIVFTVSLLFAVSSPFRALSPGHGCDRKHSGKADGPLAAQWCKAPRIPSPTKTLGKLSTSLPHRQAHIIPACSFREIILFAPKPGASKLWKKA